MAGRNREYTPEFKSRATELALLAIINNWSVAKFSRFAHIPKATVLSWLMEEPTFDRYTRAMQVKALSLPIMANNIVDHLINGKTVIQWETKDSGQREMMVRKVFPDPKAAAVALRHIEFRIQREIKKIYEPTRKIDHRHRFEDMTDDQIKAKRDELLEKALSARLRPRFDG